MHLYTTLAAKTRKEEKYEAIEMSTRGRVEKHLWYMLLILDGNSDMGAHVSVI